MRVFNVPKLVKNNISSDSNDHVTTGKQITLNDFIIQTIKLILLKI